MSYLIVLGDYAPEDAFDIKVGIGINKLRVAKFQLPNPNNKYSLVEEMQSLKISFEEKLLFDGVIDNIEDILRGGDFLGIEGIGKGYKLFNKLQTKNYEDVNGKTLIVDAVNLAGLDPSQVDPDNEIASTFTKEYEKVSTWEIIEEICQESAKETGEVGFYFYIDVEGIVHVYPYDKFTSPIVAQRGENLVSYRRKKLGRTVKNEIWVYGSPTKCKPLDKDSPWTEEITDWTSNGDLTFDTTDYKLGTGSVKATRTDAAGVYIERVIPQIKCGVAPTLHKFLNFYLKWKHAGEERPYSLHVELKDSEEKTTRYYGAKLLSYDDNEWEGTEDLPVGEDYEYLWTEVMGLRADWDDIVKIRFNLLWKTSSDVEIKVDGLHFRGARFVGYTQYPPSQTKFDKRQKSFTDDRLLNDADCLLVAKHFLATLKDSSRVIEAEISPANYDLVQGHCLRLLDVTRSIDEYARILEITHSLGEDRRTTLELSKEPLDWTPLFLSSTRKLELLSKGLEKKVI